MHARVVGCEDYQSAIHARDSRVHKRVGAHIHTHMFHADQCAFAHVGHAERAFHGGLLVGCPAAEDRLGGGTLRFMELDVLGYLRRGSAGVGIHAAQSGINSALSNRFIA